MTLATISYITLLAPLVGVLIIALLGMRLPAKSAGYVGCAAIFVAFIGSLLAISHSNDPREALITPYTWLSAGQFHVGLDLYIDRLANFMMLVVTGVGFLIHVYSLGYMEGDPQFRRFFAYLNVFIFAMLVLVMGGNLVMLLAGWGLVGMASYLLIGFWHDRPTAVVAAKKAFIVNAIGDISIMAGLFLLFARLVKVNPGEWPGAAAWTTAQAESVLTYPGLIARHLVEAGNGAAGWSTTLPALLLLGGAIAKSAQLPLHTWLPDAMEGPTPVSALIHAATMVTAGVYLVARFSFLFEFSRTAMAVTAAVGVLTLTVAGFVALVQTDIKRIIAYSTMSQIGYMFLAVGVGASSAAMFHLMTHAFFKALLFLGAGIVIHALADEQDIRKMGGLRKHMPITYALFVIASLALSGIIPLSGFFSKDEILYEAFAKSWAYGDAAQAPLWNIFGSGLWALGLLGALFTGIYSFRLLYVVFHGKESELVRQYAAGELEHHGHAAHAADASGDAAPTSKPAEAPRTMLYPVMLLGALAACSGLLVVPGAWNKVGDFLHAESSSYVAARNDANNASESTEDSRVAQLRQEEAAEESHGHRTAWLLALLVSLPLGLAGIFIATRVWKDDAWASLRTRFPGPERVFQHAFGFDALYDAVLVRPAQGLAAFCGRIEREFVEPVMDGVSVAVRASGRLVGRAQSGLVRFYALGTAGAVLALIVAAVLLES